MAANSDGHVSAGRSASYWNRLADAAGFSALVTLAGAAILSAYAWSGGDFLAFFAAGKVALIGGNPYDYGQVSRVLWDLAGSPAGSGPYYPPYYYYYPPWLALLLSPLAALPFGIARTIWMVLNVVMLAAGTWFSFVVLPWQPRGWRLSLAGIAVLYPIAWVSLMAEQVSIFVFFWLALAALLVSRLGSATGGRWQLPLASLALCLSLTKPQIAVLPGTALAYLLVRTRGPAAIAWLAFWMLTLLGLSSLLLPGWWNALDLTALVGNLTSQSQPGGTAFERVNATFMDWLAARGVADSPAIALYGILLASCCIALIRLLRREVDPGLVVATASLLGILVAPYCFEYDFVVLVPALLLGLRGVTRTRPAVQLICVAILGAEFTIHLWGRWMSDAFWIPIIFLALGIVTGELPRLFGRRGDADPSAARAG